MYHEGKKGKTKRRTKEIQNLRSDQVMASFGPNHLCLIFEDGGHTEAPTSDFLRQIPKTFYRKVLVAALSLAPCAASCAAPCAAPCVESVPGLYSRHGSRC
jgi:hypothetical protein